MKVRAIIGSLAVAALVASPGATQAALFLDSWGVTYGNWAPNGSAPANLNYVVEDWTSGGGGYLDPGYGGDEYDAEAAYLAVDADFIYIAVVTGFQPQGRQFYSDFYEAGDLLLDQGSDGSYEHAVDVSDNGALRSGNLGLANPTSFGGTAFGGVSDPLLATSWSGSSAISGYSYGAWQGRYAIEARIERELVDLTGGLKLHWTMGCGNDEIETEIEVRPVPEPGSMALLGLGVGVAAIFQARRRKK